MSFRNLILAWLLYGCVITALIVSMTGRLFVPSGGFTHQKNGSTMLPLVPQSVGIK
jgi:hypothetical protein